MFPIRFQKPASALRPFIQFYTEHVLRLRDPLFVHPVPARAAPMLEFVFGDPITAVYFDSGREETSPKIVFVGMQTRPFVQLRLQGSLLSFVIMFQPTGAGRLLHHPVNEFTNVSHDARSLFGREVEELYHRLGECKSFEHRILVADKFMQSKLTDAMCLDRIGAVANRIQNANGCVRVPELAKWAGIGSRQLEREFNARFGMRPKLFSRIVRFQGALDHKARSTKSWTEVAHEFGYHDQMHMIHDFEQFTGEAPTEALRLVEAFFREQIDAIRAGSGPEGREHVERFVI